MSKQFHSSLRWIKVLIAASTLFAFFASMPASPTSTVSAQSGERTMTITMPAAQQVHAPRLNSPPVVPAAEKARLQTEQSKFHQRGPATRANPRAASRAGVPNIPTTTSRAAAATARPRAGASTDAAGTFTLFQNTDLHSVVGSTTSVIAEPSAGNIGSAVLETGNWFAAVSTDGGSTFGYIDPFATFPSSNGGFCCDQSVIYSPSRDVMLWTLLYAPNSSGNIIRLATAQGEAALEAPSIPFYYYDFSPQVLGFPAGDWYDYPQMALGTNYLYITANVFRSDRVTFDGTVVLRLPLDPLPSGGSLSYTAFTTSYFNATPVQGATDTMYWATQADTATLRVYTWPETGDISAANITHTAYPDPSNLTSYTCPLTDGTQNWCGRLDDRVQTGWVSNGLMGFMWSAPKGSGGFGTFSYPYVQILFVNPSTVANVGESTMYSLDYAYAYPGAGINAAGHVAGTLFYGGGTTAPRLAAFIWDTFSVPAYPQIPGTWELHDVAASSQGPLLSQCPTNSPYCWGDYLAARQDHSNRYTRFLWIATGFTLQGAGLTDVHPYYLRFGREWNDPTAVEVRDKTLYFPIISKSQ